MWILMTMLNATLNRSITAIRRARDMDEGNRYRYGIYDLLKQSCLDVTSSVLSVFSTGDRKRPMTSVTARDVELEIEDLCHEDCISMNDDSEDIKRQIPENGDLNEISQDEDEEALNSDIDEILQEIETIDSGNKTNLLT